MSTGTSYTNGGIYVLWFVACSSEYVHGVLTGGGFACTQTVDEEGNLVGVVVSKLEPHRGGPLRGYIAMLAVKEEYRGKGIASKLVRKAIDAMIDQDADEVSTPPSSYAVHRMLIAGIDRPRDGNHKHGRYKTLRTARVPEK